MELMDSFEAMADEETVMRSLSVAGGYLGSSIAQSTIDGRVPVDLPNEVYGVAFGGAALAYSPVYGEEMAMGGLVYTADAAAQRFGIKQSVTSLEDL